FAPGAAPDRFVVDGNELRAAQVLAPPGPPWLCLMVELGRIDGFVLRATLVANAELPIGALALLDHQLILRQTLPIAGLLVAQLDQAMRGLARVAAELRAPASPYAYIVR